MARIMACALMLLLPLLAVKGHLVVTRIGGSSAGCELSAVGKSFASPPFLFSPESFEFEGPLVVTDVNKDWSYAPRAGPRNWSGGRCPPAFVGNATLQGAVIVHVGGLKWCSIEDHARGAAEHGAQVLPWNPQPGYDQNYWRPGDAHVGPPAADITARNMTAILACARSGARVTVRVTPSRSVWVEMWAHWTYWFVASLLGVHALAAAELACSRLHAFLREDGGFKLTIAQALLASEVVVNIARAVYLFVDPFLARSILPFAISVGLFGFFVALSIVTSGLFYAYFLQAAESAGIAALSLPSSRLFRGGFFAALMLMICLDLLTTLILLWWFDLLFYYAKAGMNGVASQLLFTSLALHTQRRVARMLHGLPESVLGKLNRKLRLQVLLCIGNLAAGMTLIPGYFTPWARTLTFGVFIETSILISWVQVDAFSPVGVRPVRGPFVLLYLAVRRLVHSLIFKMSGWCYSARSKKASRAAACAHMSIDGNYPPIDEHLLHGISIAGARAFLARHSLDVNAPSMLAGDCVREVTRASGLSYCEELAECAAEKRAADGSHSLLPLSPSSAHKVASRGDARLPSSVPVVGLATFFVSHAQQRSLSDMLDGVEQHIQFHGGDPAKEFLWIDIFCIRQHSIVEEVKSIGLVERSIGKVLLVLDPWDAPLSLKRVWCLYEVGLAARSAGEVELQLTMPPRQRVAMQAALRKDRLAVHNAVACVDARTAEASVEADKVQIFATMTSWFGVGFRHLRGSAEGSVEDDDTTAMNPAAAAAEVEYAFERFNKLVREAIFRSAAALTFSFN
ncbi:hypothetical protein T492DRAFT_1004805 [Pavlovales sp. CCMP2436]|nr:hypothetical protein T492DRAFT_1004805 [Pavlovales sp. CCMP2436]